MTNAPHLGTNLMGGSKILHNTKRKHRWKFLFLRVRKVLYQFTVVVEKQYLTSFPARILDVGYSDETSPATSLERPKCGCMLSRPASILFLILNIYIYTYV